MGCKNGGWIHDKQQSSYVNLWHASQYRKWRQLPWWRRLFTRRPQSRKLFKLK